MPLNERVPVQQQADPKDQDAAFHDLSHGLPRRYGFHFRHHETERIADGKQEKRKYQVGGRASVPGRMLQRRIDIRPGARVIDQDHEANGGAAEYVEGVEALLQGGRFSQVI